jgi:hypothetical protein
MSLSLLANDVLRGIFHYRVNISFSVAQSTQPPAVDIKLIGALTHARGFLSAIAVGPQSRRGVWIERMRNSTTRRILAFTTSQSAYDNPTEMIIPGAHNVSNEPENEEEEGTEPSHAVWMLGAKTIDANAVYEDHSYDLRGRFYL